MTIQHFQSILDSKSGYVGAGTAGFLGWLSTILGLIGGVDSIWVVILCSIGGGLAANFHKIFSVYAKKQSDDRDFVSKHYRAIIEDYIRQAQMTEQALQLHVVCRHDLQGALNAAYLRLDLLDEIYNIKEEDKIPRFDVEARIRELDQDLLKIKGFAK